MESNSRRRMESSTRAEKELDLACTVDIRFGHDISRVACRRNDGSSGSGGRRRNLDVYVLVVFPGVYMRYSRYCC